MAVEPRIILVTGALAGIGRVIATAFARLGDHVVVAGRRDDAGEAFADELRSLGTEAHYVRADVRHDYEVRRLVDQTVSRFGRLDVAVNNAGVEQRPGALVEQTLKAYTDIFDTNVLGAMLSMKYELRVMQAQRCGSIINISSSMGHKAAANMALYVASKHALEGMTKAAALEAAPHGVRVNAIAPGPVDTEMLGRLTGTPEREVVLRASVPLGRFGLPEEVAQTALFLASDQAAFITGHILAVDGGKSAG